MKRTTIKIAPVLMLLLTVFNISGFGQSWQWLKKGGSTSDNLGAKNPDCKISGCDAKGNVYGSGMINGPGFVLDTFHHGSYAQQCADYVVFSFDCAGKMRWAKQVGSEYQGQLWNSHSVTNLYGETYLLGNYYFGQGSTLVPLHIGDTVIGAAWAYTNETFLMKFDSLGSLKWIHQLRPTHGLAGTPHGLRLGSSGNLWMVLYMDSNISLGSSFSSTKSGFYHIEFDPQQQTVVSGYFVKGVFSTSTSNPEYKYDIDEDENYYEGGVLFPAQSSINDPGDTLKLSSLTYAPDSNKFVYGSGFVFSLSKTGALRFFRHADRGASPVFAVKYDEYNHALLLGMSVDSSCIFGQDTFKFPGTKYLQVTGSLVSPAILSLSENGATHWKKFGMFANVSTTYAFIGPLAGGYFSGTPKQGFTIFNDGDTMRAYGNPPGNTTMMANTKINIQNGKIEKVLTANLASGTYLNYGHSSAMDWRGNLYMSGPFTSSVATPVDSIKNTNSGKGSFFIAKIGSSDCSCPTPGAQYSYTTSGDTLRLFGYSVNRRDSIRWNLGDNSYHSGDTFMHVYSNDGTYTVTAIAYNGCGRDSISRQISVLKIGIPNVKEIGETLVYPNPSSGAFTVSVKGSCEIGLVSASGQSVWEQPVTVKQSGSYYFEGLKDRAPGMYYCIVAYPYGETEVLKIQLAK